MSALRNRSEHFARFVEGLERGVERTDPAGFDVQSLVSLMAALVASDDWLPAEYAAPKQDRYQQYLLHLDHQARFSVVSFVWGPDQRTPIHDHGTWGVVGILRGAEEAQSYCRAEGRLHCQGTPLRLGQGAVCAFTPKEGDIHEVRNAFSDQVSISIHAYGCDIGKAKRHVFDPTTGEASEFISSYSPVAVA